MNDWVPTLSDGPKPRYIAIAEAIQGDLAEGRLLPAQRLPAQRQLARLLGLDFTTVARGYGEAQRRGLIEFGWAKALSSSASRLIATGPPHAPRAKTFP